MNGILLKDWGRWKYNLKRMLTPGHLFIERLTDCSYDAKRKLSYS